MVVLLTVAHTAVVVPLTQSPVLARWSSAAVDPAGPIHSKIRIVVTAPPPVKVVSASTSPPVSLVSYFWQFGVFDGPPRPPAPGLQKPSFPWSSGAVWRPVKVPSEPLTGGTVATSSWKNQKPASLVP